MIQFLLFVAIFTVILDAMDANCFHKWLHNRGAWFTNRWKEKYNEDGTLKWWARLGLDAFLDFWHTAKSVLLVGTFSYVAYLNGLSCWFLWGLGSWIFVFGTIHKYICYGKWKQ